MTGHVQTAKLPVLMSEYILDRTACSLQAPRLLDWGTQIPDWVHEVKQLKSFTFIACTVHDLLTVF